jgi:hypothetical protein
LSRASLPPAVNGQVGRATLVIVTFADTSGLGLEVAVALIVTVPPVGTLAGAVYTVVCPLAV